MTDADPRVDAYIDRLPGWQQEVCRQVRELVHAADPEVAETIKFRDRPYFVLGGNVCALLAATDHVNVFLYDGGIVPDPEGIITGGHTNTTARSISIYEGQTINASALVAMLRQIIANNRAGGWRKLKRETPRGEPEDAVMQEPLRVLVPGRGLVEAPRWHDGRCYFSDWTAGEILAVDPGGRTEVIAQVASLPLCSAWLPDGRLLIMASAQRRLLRREPDGSLATHAELDGPGWNDIVADGRGNAYVNSVGFDLMAGEDARPGHVVLATPQGVVRRVAEDLDFPNGMAVTPDNATLIVAESYGQRLTAFDIGSDGDLTRRRVFAELDDPPDGICVDAEGAVWYATVPGRRCVRVAEGGTVLQTIQLDRGCFACTLGGPDRTTLFITAAQWRDDLPELVPAGSGRLYAAEVTIPGAGWP